MFTEAGNRGAQLRQKFFDAIDDRDDVRAGLALDVHDDGWLLVHPGGLPDIFGAIDDGGDI